MAYTIKERRAAFVGLLVCLGYMLLICIQLGLYVDKELDNYGDPGYWTVYESVSLLACSIVAAIDRYSVIVNLSLSLLFDALLSFIYIWAFIFIWVAGGSLIFHGFLLPATPLQYHVFVWFWGLLLSIGLFIIYKIPGVVYNICRKNCPSFMRNCSKCFSSHSQKFYQLFTNYSDPKCSICLLEMIDFDDLENERQRTIKTLACGHNFHCHCIDNWTRLNNSCPICRNPIEGHQAIPVEGHQVIRAENNEAIPAENNEMIPAENNEIIMADEVHVILEEKELLILR